MKGNFVEEAVKKIGKTNTKQTKFKKFKKQGLKLSRSQCIRSKKIIYPLSTSEKIVFITNQYGVGFRRQNLQDLGCPSHIPTDHMLKEINQTCYNEWKQHFQEIQKKPFTTLQFILGGVFTIVTLLTVIYFALISKTKIEGFQFINIIFLILVFCIIIMAFVVCLSRKHNEQSLDNKLIRIIKQKLMQFNASQQDLYSYQARFRWSCHQDCLWIALNIL